MAPTLSVNTPWRVVTVTRSVRRSYLLFAAEASGLKVQVEVHPQVVAYFHRDRAKRNTGGYKKTT